MARYDLGLSDEEFGDLTYGLLEALVDRLREDQRKEYLRVGVVAAAVINSGFCRPEKPVKPTDFVPGLGDEGPDLSRMTPAEQEKYWLGQFAKKSITVK